MEGSAVTSVGRRLCRGYIKIDRRYENKEFIIVCLCSYPVLFLCAGYCFFTGEYFCVSGKG